MKEWREGEREWGRKREKWEIDKFGYPNGFYVYAVSVREMRVCVSMTKLLRKNDYLNVSLFSVSNFINKKREKDTHIKPFIPSLSVSRTQCD